MRHATGNIGQMESWMAYDVNTICVMDTLVSLHNPDNQLLL